jgi:hypothetical protein
MTHFLLQRRNRSYNEREEDVYIVPLARTLFGFPSDAPTTYYRTSAPLEWQVDCINEKKKGMLKNQEERRLMAMSTTDPEEK